ncbi:MAG: pilus assembly protein TadG-related protein [Pseudomonadota bacterium]
MRKIKNWTRRLARAERGNVIVMMALSIIPIIAVVGMAIDMSRIHSARMQTWALLDQAALAAANLAHDEDPNTLVKEWMESRVSQFGHSAEDLSISVQSDVTFNSKTVTTTASLRVDTAIMHLLGREEVYVTVSSTAEQSISNIEIAMVLDISSSMRGSRLTSLRAASTEFVDIMLTDETKTTTSINVVPFGGTVNIGTNLFNKFAVQVTGFGTVLDPSESQYSIGTGVETSDFRFSDGNTCIEAQQSDYDTAMIPNLSRGQVPDFWRWWNNHPWCPEDQSAVFLNSNDAEALKTHLNGMVLSDGTGMDIGALWGLKTLSPSFRGALGGDFSQRPLDFDARESKKVMIIMTDGNITQQNRPEDPAIGNVHSNRPTNNTPIVGAFSNQGDRGNMQTSRGRGGASTNSANNSAVGRFKKACEAAKAEEIQVFTVGFQIRSGSLADRILAECASNTSLYYHVESLDLTATFQSIAARVNALRLTK